jgi:hypothetical protein
MSRAFCETWGEVTLILFSLFRSLSRNLTARSTARLCWTDISGCYDARVPCMNAGAILHV